MNKAVFLDRDGTVIRDMVYLNDPNQIYFYEDTFSALKRLHGAGYLLVVVTNQSGVARGLVQMENLKKINEIIVAEFKKHDVPISAVYYCPHAVDAGCDCRKPMPGMIHQGAQELDIDLKKSWMIGDRMSDVDAGINAGCRSILLTEAASSTADESRYFQCKNLSECASLILTKTSPLIA